MDADSAGMFQNPEAARILKTDVETDGSVTISLQAATELHTLIPIVN